MTYIDKKRGSADKKPKTDRVSKIFLFVEFLHKEYYKQLGRKHAQKHC